MKEINEHKKGKMQAIGLVFSEIGIAPIYALSIIFLIIANTPEQILGVLSLIFWSLFLIVTVQYTWLALSLNKRGESGTVVLYDAIRNMMKSNVSKFVLTILAFLGISLYMGESILTPAVGILSSLEGVRVLPKLSGISTYIIMGIALCIVVEIFYMQKYTTKLVSKYFYLFTAIWFLLIGALGALSILETSYVLSALNPLIGIDFLLHNGVKSFIVLCAILLCVSGTKSLYGDVSHLERKYVVRAWYFVFLMLVLSYFGQGAFLMRHPEVNNVFYSFVYQDFHILFVPILVFSLLMVINSCNSMMFGVFTVVFQAINTRLLPLLKVDYTSKNKNSQIYIETINSVFLVMSVLSILILKTAKNAIFAYGLAVAGCFCITAILMTVIFYLKKNYFNFTLALCLLVVDIFFLLSALPKIYFGAYISCGFALFIFAIMTLYVRGQKTLFRSINLMDRTHFLAQYEQAYNDSNVTKLEGTALFFARGVDRVPPYISQTMFSNKILYSENMFIHVEKDSEPFGLHYHLERVSAGLRILRISVGYMESFRIEKVLKLLQINPNAIFYGVEDISTSNPFWSLFALIKKITPSFVSYYKMPVNKLHGVITRVTM
ncbi:MAG: KUP/HAK/KT family potassium transporter [bacterium]|nr:KUP/HAK/KT family potassium transporter [bacterium]